VVRTNPLSDKHRLASTDLSFCASSSVYSLESYSERTYISRS